MYGLRIEIWMCSKIGASCLKQVPVVSNRCQLSQMDATSPKYSPCCKKSHLGGGKCFNILGANDLGFNFDVKCVVEILRLIVPKFSQVLSAHCDTRVLQEQRVGEGLVPDAVEFLCF